MPHPLPGLSEHVWLLNGTTGKSIKKGAFLRSSWQISRSNEQKRNQNSVGKALIAAPKRKDLFFFFSETCDRCLLRCPASISMSDDENRKQVRIHCLHRSRYPGHLDLFDFHNVLTSLIAFRRSASVSADKSLFFFFFFALMLQTKSH